MHLFAFAGFAAAPQNCPQSIHRVCLNRELNEPDNPTFWRVHVPGCEVLVAAAPLRNAFGRRPHTGPMRSKPDQWCCATPPELQVDLSIRLPRALPSDRESL